MLDLADASWHGKAYCCRCKRRQMVQPLGIQAGKDYRMTSPEEDQAVWPIDSYRCSTEPRSCSRQWECMLRQVHRVGSLAYTWRTRAPSERERRSRLCERRYTGQRVRWVASTQAPTELRLFR